MTPAQARQTLAAWRPGLSGDPGPEVEAALALTRQDPDLGVWWAHQQRFHRAMSASLRSAQPPNDLADRILAARKTHHPAFRPRPGLAWWIAAAAAAAVILVGLWFAFPAGRSSEERFEIFRGRMVRAVLREYRMDVVSPELPTIRSFLARNRAPSDFALPPALSRAPAMGGGLLSWRGRPVSMVCLNGGDLGTLFLFVAPSDSLPTGTPGAREYVQVNRLSTVSWTEGGHAFVLAAESSPERLKGFLEAGPQAGLTFPPRPPEIRPPPRDRGPVRAVSSHPTPIHPPASSCAPGASQSPAPARPARRAAAPRRPDAPAAG